MQGEVTQENLEQARQVMEALQLAELDNFFREACLDAKPVQIDRLDPKAAIFYPIILPDRLEVIVAIPGQPLRNYRSQISQEQLELVLDGVASDITELNTLEKLQPNLEKLFHWTIKPIVPELQTQDITTLIFVMDGKLRNIPIAALYDGEQYLIEQYQVALAPSLQLIEPEALTRSQWSVFLGGLTEARQGFSSLPGVKKELENIQQQVEAQNLIK